MSLQQELKVQAFREKYLRLERVRRSMQGGLKKVNWLH
jgi:hypothetical protein